MLKMHLLSKTIRQFVEATPNVKRVVVAYSGGVDSTVLLHAAANAGLTQPIYAIHINHQLSDNADTWQAHCAEIFTKMEVSGVCLKVNVDDKGSGLEQAARNARYKAIAENVSEGDLVLTGHHQQDQVETFFLRLARGAGLRGLTSMAAIRPLAKAQLGRPLLSTSKDEIQAYAESNQLSWIEDESNAVSKFDRNFLRLHALPSIQLRWPAFASQVCKTTELLAETECLLSEYTNQDLELLNIKTERVGHSIELKGLLEWGEPRRNAVIRQWLLTLGFRCPAQQQFCELTRLIDAAIDKSPVLQWTDCEIRRYKQRLYCLPKGWTKTALAKNEEVTFKPAAQGFKLGPKYCITHRKDHSAVIRCRPKGREHSQKLKKLLQEYSLEPWLRDRVPLIMDGEKLVAVGDLWVENDCWQELKGSCVVGWSL